MSGGKVIVPSFSKFKVEVIAYRMVSLWRLELDSCVYVIKILFNLKSQGNEKFGLFAKRPTTFKIWENETLFIAGHENVKKSTFD